MIHTFFFFLPGNERLFSAFLILLVYFHKLEITLYLALSGLPWNPFPYTVLSIHLFSLVAACNFTVWMDRSEAFCARINYFPCLSRAVQVAAYDFNANRSRSLEPGRGEPLCL